MSTNRDEEILEHATSLVNRIERDNDPEISHLIFDCAILLSRQITNKKKVTVKEFKYFIKQIDEEIFNQQEKDLVLGINRRLGINRADNDGINNSGLFGAFCEGLYLGWKREQDDRRSSNDKSQNLYFAIIRKNRDLIHKIYDINNLRNDTFHESGDTNDVPVKLDKATIFYNIVTKIYEEIQKEKETEENKHFPSIREQKLENKQDITNNKKQPREFHYGNSYENDDYEEDVPVRSSGNISCFNNIRILKEY